MKIVCGIDAHDKELVCRIWRTGGEEETKRVRNAETGRLSLWAYLGKLRDKYSADGVTVGYETCGLGYLIYDESIAMGFTCYIMATVKMPKSTFDGKRKTDEYDANMLCETLVIHELTGKGLHAIWVPGKELRDDRELVRRRFDVKSESTQVKNKIHGLLKRHGIKKPESIKSNWTKEFMTWLDSLQLPNGARANLDSLVSMHKAFDENVKKLDLALGQLAEQDRYRKQVDTLLDIHGVGVLTSMVFLTELGDLNRFPNRRNVKSFVGLAPSSHESGDVKDRKGAITRNGSSRLRGILCQAVWARLANDAEEKAWFEHYIARHAKGKRKAVVACMGRLLQLMWHRALEAQHENERLIA